MMKNNVLKNYYVVVGLGQTGLSCVRYLLAQNKSVVVVDSRDNPPALATCRQQFPEVDIYLGAFSKDLFLAADTLVVSPGVSLLTPEIVAANEQGVRVIGDVELFAAVAKAPIIAITGSNGKSTVVTLIGKMIVDAGLKAIVCGNIGLPVLEALLQPVPDYYVVELSSFQLAATQQLNAHVAVLLNISPDHLDQHKSFAAYLAAKKRIYKNCDQAVVNADEPETWSELTFDKPVIPVSLNAPEENVWGVKNDALYWGETKLVDIAHLALQEKHNCQNFLVALAVGQFIGLPLDKMIATLRSFSGLSHRCQLVSKNQGVHWINDSKATNVGAAVAAIESVAKNSDGKIILILGGDSKGVDLGALRQPIDQYVSCVIALGKDAEKIKNTLSDLVKVVLVNTISEAVLSASRIAMQGDTVLLSPACSSLDQYASYVARGDDFVQAVSALSNVEAGLSG